MKRRTSINNAETGKLTQVKRNYRLYDIFRFDLLARQCARHRPKVCK